MTHNRAARIRRGVQPPQLAHPLAELGRRRIDQGAAIARQAQQTHAYEGHGDNGDMTKTGLAVASSCTSCAALISNPPAWAPGRHMAPIHASHVPELQALGWVMTEYPHEPPDVACPHYHAAYWQDG